MTVIRILLIIGLVYIALQQKKTTTRNIILVVTGLLAFCMMGKEGLMIVDENTTAQDAVSETCTPTVTDCATGYTAGTEAAPSSTCPTGCTQVNAAGAAAETCTPTVTDCAGYTAGTVAIPSTTCPTGCTFTPAVAAISDSTPRAVATDSTGRLSDMAALFGSTCVRGAVIQEDGSCLDGHRTNSDFCSNNWIATRYDPLSQNEGNCCNPGGITDGDCPARS
jgi:hypothetical protein